MWSNTKTFVGKTRPLSAVAVKWQRCPKSASRSGIEPDGLIKPVSVVFDAAQLPHVIEYEGIEPCYLRDINWCIHPDSNREPRGKCPSIYQLNLWMRVSVFGFYRLY